MRLLLPIAIGKYLARNDEFFKFTNHLFTFTKIERLCGKTAIDELFATGKSKTQFPFKLIYKVSEFDTPYPARVLFVVPKKKHKRANKRNDIKRRMREVYRLNKQELYNSLTVCKLDIMFICLSNEELSYAEIEKSILALMQFLKVQFKPKEL